MWPRGIPRDVDAGYIPKELGDLDKLERLTLSDNILIGKGAARLRIIVGRRLIVGVQL